nr:putative reverse transcriptase domain-containing protein [Tanacetum cinerariifolium]
MAHELVEQSIQSKAARANDGGKESRMTTVEDKECRFRPTDGNPREVECWECGAKGHTKNRCPKLGDGQNNQARGRVYQVVVNAQQNPTVVAGTFILNDHYASVLFDS